MKHCGTLALLLGTLLGAGAHAQSTPKYTPPAALVDAAKKEGHLTLYTVMDPESELRMVRAFNQDFPFVKVDMLRLPGGQLLTRVKAESSAGRLSADLMAFSDPEEVAQIASNFTDYAPPNASDYHDPEAGVNHTWPRAVGAWTICSNTMIEKDPPNSWQDLTKPQYKGHLGEVTILTGGSGWTRSFFQRTVFGKEYWQKLADNKPRLYPSGVPMTDAMIRGEVSVGAIVVNQALPRIAEGAPLQCRFGAEGIPTMPQMIGLTKTAQSPNAARLYLNWMLSPEGQAFVVKDWYMFSGLEGAPRPVGADKAKTWSVNREDSRRVHAQWTSDWVQIFSAPK